MFKKILSTIILFSLLSSANAAFVQTSIPQQSKVVNNGDILTTTTINGITSDIGNVITDIGSSVTEAKNYTDNKIIDSAHIGNGQVKKINIDPSIEFGKWKDKTGSPGTIYYTGNIDVGDATNISNINVTGNTTIKKNLQVDGNSTTTGDSSIGGKLNVTGSGNIGGKLNVTGDSSIGGKLNVTGDSSIGGSLNVSGTGLINDKLTVSGSTDKIVIDPNGTSPSISINDFKLYDTKNGKLQISDINKTLISIYGTGVEITGEDLKLGTNDTLSVGTKTSQRALKHTTNDTLNLNYKGDFEGGVVIGNNDMKVGSGIIEINSTKGLRIVKDTSGINHLPDWYATGSIHQALVEASTISLPAGTETMAYLKTINKKDNLSQNNKVVQIAINSDKMFLRSNTAATTWGTWKEIGSGAGGGNTTCPSGQTLYKTPSQNYCVDTVADIIGNVSWFVARDVCKRTNNQLPTYNQVTEGGGSFGIFAQTQWLRDPSADNTVFYLNLINQTNDFDGVAPRYGSTTVRCMEPVEKAKVNVVLQGTVCNAANKGKHYYANNITQGGSSFVSCDGSKWNLRGNNSCAYWHNVTTVTTVGAYHRVNISNTNVTYVGDYWSSTGFGYANRAISGGANTANAIRDSFTVIGRAHYRDQRYTVPAAYRSWRNFPGYWYHPNYIGRRSDIVYYYGWGTIRREQYQYYTYQQTTTTKVCD